MLRAASFILAILAMPALAAEVTGTATYLARIATPPGAVFEASLLDVSVADAPSVTLGVDRREDAGNPPYRFAIPYDAAAIDPSRRYAVRATLTLPDGRLFFTSDTVNPVLTQGAPDTVEIVMVPAGAGREAAEPKPLVGPRWALSSLGGTPAPADTKAHLVFDQDGRLAGDGGCNRMGAAYIARPDGAFLASNAFSTMMACPEPAMATERGVFDALDRARRWAIEGDRLTLSDEAGVALAVFAATAGE